MTRHVRVRLLPLLALAAAAVVAGPAVTVSASVTFTASSFFIDLNIPPPFGPSNIDTLITGSGFTMQQGETRRVTEQIDVSVNTTIAPEVNNAVYCTDPAGNEIGRASAGTNLVGRPGRETWRLSMLITADAPGNATYHCGIDTYTHDSHSSGYQMTVWPMNAADGTSTGTWIQVSSAGQVGAHQWPVYPDDRCVPDDFTGVCVYVGGSHALPAWDFADAFQWDRWTAGNDATTIDASGYLQVTSCPDGTDSCEVSQTGSDYQASAETYMEVDQLNPDGSVCQVNRDYGRTADGQPGSYYFTVTTTVHHEPISYHLSAPVSQNCGGSRTFQANLHFQWVAGDPLKLENGDINVIDSERATTTTVPDVLHGNQGQADTEAQADAAIQGAGLTVAPAYVISPDPRGTVISQNSPGGTIEPTGSPVQITVSLGQATVPNVLSYDQASAEQAIENAGLTLDTPGHVNNCIDPGTVQSQNPPAGDQVPPGTTMHIDISTCTSTGGGGGGNNGGNPHQPQLGAPPAPTVGERLPGIRSSACAHGPSPRPSSTWPAITRRRAAAFSASSSASSCANPRCSISRDPRRDDHTT
jgi:hypothetical protein